MQHSNRSKKTQKHKFVFEAFGTPWTIETPAELSRELREAVVGRLTTFDQTYSRFRNDSSVSRLKSPGTYKFPADFPKLFEIYQTCYQLSHGAMTPLIGSMLEQAGYDRDYSLKVGQLHAPPAFEGIVWDGSQTITTKEPIVFDIGAAGKGYAVDIVSQILETAGQREYVIDASGDIRHRGESIEQIGLEDPSDSSRVLGVARLQNKSLCASASNRRAWHGVHHIMNPKTLQPVENIVATWVIADEAIVADAMATALFFVDSPDPLRHEFNFSYVRLRKDRTIDYSDNFEGQLFT